MTKGASGKAGAVQAADLWVELRAKPGGLPLTLAELLDLRLGAIQYPEGSTHLLDVPDLDVRIGSATVLAERKPRKHLLSVGDLPVVIAFCAPVTGRTLVEHAEHYVQPDAAKGTQRSG